MRYYEYRYYVYLIVNIVNGKKYIGQHSVDPNKHPVNDNYMGSGVYLMRDMKEIGKLFFTKTILEMCKTKQEAADAEKKFIDLNNAMYDDNFYNVALGGLSSINDEEHQKVFEESNFLKKKNLINETIESIRNVLDETLFDCNDVHSWTVEKISTFFSIPLSEVVKAYKMGLLDREETYIPQDIPKIKINVLGDNTLEYIVYKGKLDIGSE